MFIDNSLCIMFAPLLHAVIKKHTIEIENSFLHILITFSGCVDDIYKYNA